jgi:outer membrane protein, multidrug efflux system
MAQASRVLSWALVLTAAMCIAGCFTVGPDYERPGVDVPATWRIDLPKAQGVANTRWWEAFGDPVLDRLIDDSLRGNLDVRVAAARIDQFIGALTSTRAQSLPQIGYSTAVSRNRASEVGFPPLSPILDPQFNLFQAALGASWQADLFGRVRRLSEAAQAQVFASEQAQRGVVLSLVASVAASYITLRGLDRQREIAVATAANFGETVRIFTLRYNSGLVSETELNEARAQWKLAQVAIPAIDQQIAALENGLSILMGRNPGPIPRGRPVEELLLPAIPADLPSTLLERRPDVLQAEENLVSANANVGAARALYYPDISLTGLFGSTSAAFGDFLTGPATAWSVGASLAGPIFTSGAIEGQVQSAEAARAQADLFYRQTILGAFNDTNNALTGFAETARQVRLQQERVTSLNNYARLVGHKFAYGLIGYFEVQVAENDLFSARLTLAGLYAQRLTQIVSVYQAMGGGWVDLADARTPMPLQARERRPQVTR